MREFWGRPRYDVGSVRLPPMRLLVSDLDELGRLMATAAGADAYVVMDATGRDIAPAAATTNLSGDALRQVTVTARSESGVTDADRPQGYWEGNLHLGDGGGAVTWTIGAAGTGANLLLDFASEVVERGRVRWERYIIWALAAVLVLGAEIPALALLIGGDVPGQLVALLLVLMVVVAIVVGGTAKSITSLDRPYFRRIVIDPRPHDTYRLDTAKAKRDLFFLLLGATISAVVALLR